MNADIKSLKELIEKSNKIVFFGGAGVSTESGIPDFRSKDGLYNKDLSFYGKHEPEYFLSRECLDSNPSVFFRFYRDFLDVKDFQPNMAHYYLAELERRGKLLGIVTQNIDGLHQKAGSKKVFEIHGNTQDCYCKKCHKKYTADAIIKSENDIPRCTCGGIIRPNVTLYGEQLPQDAVNQAIQTIHEADLLIVAGTSLTVYPACNYIYEFEGNNMVIINRDPLPKLPTMGPDDFIILGSVGEIFSQL